MRSSAATLAGNRGKPKVRRPRAARSWRSSRPSGVTCRTPSTWATGSSSGYPREGKWHRPAMDVVALYVDQKPEGDQSAERAAELRLQGLSDHRRGPALRRAEAGGRRRPDHRRARRLSAKRKRPDPLPALRILPPGGRRLRGRRPRRAGLQRQAPVVQLRQGQGDGRCLEAAEVPVPGRLVAAGHLAAAIRSSCRSAARSRTHSWSAWAVRTRWISTHSRPCSAWSSAGEAARRASKPCS